MEYVKLGKSGLKVSRICLGAMSFGNTAPWMIEKEDAIKVINKAWDLGINFFDTANVYSRGRSEEILGEALKGRRDDAIIATKVYGKMGNGPNDSGLSRKHIMRQIDNSLKRLQTNYIDLYQIHRWDYETPIEETLSILTDLVRQGKVRYIGASSMWTWQFATAIFIAEMKGFEKFISMQNRYNLLYREEEREMIPFCKANSIGIIPWSPTAAGVLSDKFYKDGKIVIPNNETRVANPESDEYKVYIAPPENSEIIRRAAELAKNKGATISQIAIAWLLHKGVTAPIIGTTKPEHVEEAVEATTIKLYDNEIKYLEEPYKPKPVSGHR
ncbi:MAG: aldo/keto reductase [Thermoprotei archaeon]|jgi:aryl-alcohol dehydrogenase (NADP+)